MTQERRRIALVTLAVASCMVVAFAARVDVSSATDAAFRPGPGVAQGGTIAFFVLAVVATLLVVWAVWPQAGPRRPARRRSWRDVVAFTIATLVLALLLSLFQNGSGGERRARSEPTSALGRVEERLPPPDDRSDPASAKGSIAVALVAVAALAAGAVIARRRAATSREAAGDGDAGGAAGGGDASPSETSRAATARAAIDAAIEEHDPRESIRLAYRAAELVLAPTPARRTATAAPREWLRTARRSPLAPAVATPLATLVRAYEVARFSDHEPSRADRDDALAALHDLDRAARTGVPAPG